MCHKVYTREEAGDVGASFQAVAASLSRPPFLAKLREVANPKTEPFRRLAAARGVAGARVSDRQLEELAVAVAKVGALELPTLLNAFSQFNKKTPSIGVALLESLQRAPGRGAVRGKQLRAVFSTFPKETRIRAEPLIKSLQPDDAARTRQLRELEAQLDSGDANRGRAVFFSNAAACSACHRIKGEGGQIGPDLSTISRVRTRRDLIESVLAPSATIVNGFETYTVVTSEGRTLQGVIQRATTRHLVLRNAQRNEVTVARNQIERLIRSETSIMPAGLDRSLSLRQISDLVAFLQTLR